MKENWKDCMKVCAVVAVIMFAKWLVSLPQKNAHVVVPAEASQANAAMDHLDRQLFKPAPQVNPFLTPPAPPANAARFAAPPTAATQAWLDRNPWFNSPEHPQATRRARAIDKQMHDEGYRVEFKDYFKILDRRLLEAGVVVRKAKPVDWSQYSPAH